MTRKFVAINVHVSSQSFYSTVLVAISSFGICFGPGMSSILQFAHDRNLGPTKLFDANIFSFMMIFVYAILLVLVLLFFKGYTNRSQTYFNKPVISDSILCLEDYNQRNDDRDNILFKSDFYAYPNFKTVIVNKKLSKHNTSLSNPNELKLTETQDSPSLRAFFPNRAIIVVTIIFFILKIIQESFFTEFPQLSKTYYAHSSQWVGWFLFLSSLYGNLSSNTNFIV